MNHINISNRLVILFHPYWLYIEQHSKETYLSHYDCNKKFLINPTNHTHIQICESLLHSHGFWQWQRLWESWLASHTWTLHVWLILPCLPDLWNLFHALCDGNLDIQETGNTKVIYVYLIGAFSRKDQHRESQGTQSEDGEQSNIRILYRRTEGCPSEPVQTGSAGLC